MIATVSQVLLQLKCQFYHVRWGNQNYDHFSLFKLL